MKTYGSIGIAPRIVNLGSRRRWMITSRHLCLMPGSESQYALGGKLCVPQSQPRIRKDEKLSVLSGDEKGILWLSSSVTIVTELRSK
jgi:hypothetical protein